MKTYSAYLFDMDGTLVNSEKFKGMALSKACMKFDGQASVEDYRTVMGNSWSVVIDHFFKAAQISPNTDEFNSVFQNIYQDLLKRKLQLNKGAKNLLLQLKSANKKLAIVSSAANLMVNQILNRLEISEFFDIIISQEDVKKHKPDPEAFLLALNKFSISNSEALVFEDSYAGIIAAYEAGCDSIAFQHEFNVNHDLSLAVRKISSFAEAGL